MADFSKNYSGSVRREIEKSEKEISESYRKLKESINKQTSAHQYLYNIFKTTVVGEIVDSIKQIKKTSESLDEELDKIKKINSSVNQKMVSSIESFIKANKNNYDSLQELNSYLEKYAALTKKQAEIAYERNKIEGNRNLSKTEKSDAQKALSDEVDKINGQVEDVVKKLAEFGISVENFTKILKDSDRVKEDDLKNILATSEATKDYSDALKNHSISLGNSADNLKGKFGKLGEVVSKVLIEGIKRFAEDLKESRKNLEPETKTFQPFQYIHGMNAAQYARFSQNNRFVKAYLGGSESRFEDYVSDTDLLRKYGFYGNEKAEQATKLNKTMFNSGIGISRGNLDDIMRTIATSAGLSGKSLEEATSEAIETSNSLLYYSMAASAKSDEERKNILRSILVENKKIALSTGATEEIMKQRQQDTESSAFAPMIERIKNRFMVPIRLQMLKNLGFDYTQEEELLLSKAAAGSLSRSGEEFDKYQSFLARLASHVGKFNESASTNLANGDINKAVYLAAAQGAFPDLVKYVQQGEVQNARVNNYGAPFAENLSNNVDNSVKDVNNDKTSSVFGAFQDINQAFGGVPGAVGAFGLGIGTQLLLNKATPRISKLISSRAASSATGAEAATGAESAASAAGILSRYGPITAKYGPRLMKGGLIGATIGVGGGLLVDKLKDNGTISAETANVADYALNWGGTGAAIGTLLGGPGVGTAIGAGLGALAGGLYGLYKNSETENAKSASEETTSGSVTLSDGTVVASGEDYMKLQLDYLSMIEKNTRTAVDENKKQADKNASNEKAKQDLAVRRGSKAAQVTSVAMAAASPIYDQVNKDMSSIGNSLTAYEF